MQATRCCSGSTVLEPLAQMHISQRPAFVSLLIRTAVLTPHNSSCHTHSTNLLQKQTIQATQTRTPLSGFMQKQLNAACAAADRPGQPSCHHPAHSHTLTLKSITHRQPLCRNQLTLSINHHAALMASCSMRSLIAARIASLFVFTHKAADYCAYAALVASCSMRSLTAATIASLFAFTHTTRLA